jgi:hypothetical protein
MCGPGSSVGIATDYGLDGPGIELTVFCCAPMRYLLCDSGGTTWGRDWSWSDEAYKLCID